MLFIDAPDLIYIKVSYLTVRISYIIVFDFQCILAGVIWILRTIEYFLALLVLCNLLSPYSVIICGLEYMYTHIHMCSCLCVCFSQEFTNENTQCWLAVQRHTQALLAGTWQLWDDFGDLYKHVYLFNVFFYVRSLLGASYILLTLREISSLKQ